MSTNLPDDVTRKFFQALSDKLEQDILGILGVSAQDTAPVSFEDQLELVRKELMAERGPQIRLTVIHPDDWDEMVTMMTEVGDFIIPHSYEDDGWRYQLVHVYEPGWTHVVDLCVLDTATKGEYTLIAETPVWQFGRKP
jgi:hypothetical protein